MVGTVNGTDQPNFPMLFSGTFPTLATKANGGGVQNTTSLNGQTVPADLIFTSDSACQNKLNWEISSYGSSTGRIEAWVQIPTLSHSADTVITLCYGNTSITAYQGSATSTWDGDYVAVYHMGDGVTFSTTDSTANGNNGTNNGVGAAGGKMGLGGAGQFTAANSDWITLPSLSLGTTHTASAWVQPDTQTGAYNFGTVIGSNSGSNIAPLAVAGATDTAIGYTQGTGGVGYGGPSMTSSWHYVVSVRNGLNVTLYMDGQQVTSGSLPANEAAIIGAIGMRNPNFVYYNGLMDEVRLSTNDRSADWIVTEYNNQNSPGTFYTLSSNIIPAGYANVRPITIDHTKVGAVSNTDQPNFPVLVAGTYPYLATQGNGGSILNETGVNGGEMVPADLIFTSDSACTHPLNWEIPSYNSLTGQIEAWVQVPNLSSSSDTVIYMCYGNPAVTTYQSIATSTWDGNYAAVYHMGDGIRFSTTDSTANGNNGINNKGSNPNTGVTAAAGQIGGAGQFIAANSDWITLPSPINLGTTHTASAWVQPDTQTGAYNFGTILGTDSSSNIAPLFVYGANDTQFGYTQGASGAGYNTSSMTGGWHYLVSVRNGLNITFYLDGQQVSSGALPANEAAIIGAIGMRNPNFVFYNGLMDEVRLSTSDRSADWINTEYNNQLVPDKASGAGGFYTIGTVAAPH